MSSNESKATMEQLTAGEHSRRYEVLENAAGSLLGQMLFEFGRLELSINLCIVWVDGGQHLDALTHQMKALTLHEKLEFLTKHIEHTFNVGSKSRAAYSRWLKEAHKARATRNTLVHGRWGVDAHTGHVFNVAGIPTGADQIATSYTLSDLEAVLLHLRQLQSELSVLRETHPL